MAILDDALGTLQRAVSLMRERPALTELRLTFEAAERQLKEPMTVAIVGRMKAGKSTLTSALLGANLAAVGRKECTFNVCVFRYGDAPAMVVHYDDDRPPERRDPNDLEVLSRRPPKKDDVGDGIHHIDFYYPSPLLRVFTLVDTPGLESPAVDDSKNTLDWLGASSAKAAGRTAAEAEAADAVIYLFSRGMTSAGAHTVAEFVGPSFRRATPLNAIGVLTRFDIYYKTYADPLEKSGAIAHDLFQEAAVSRLFYAVRSVSGQIALGAQLLSQEDFATLLRVAALTDEEVRELAEETDDFPEVLADRLSLPIDAGASLFTKLDQYGIVLACEMLRAGATSLEALRSDLLTRSGVRPLEELIVSHFGNRSILIKLERILARLREACFASRRRLTGDDGVVLATISGLLEALEVGEHGFAELEVLKKHYHRPLNIDASELEEVLRVTGERGTSLEARLGPSAGHSREELASYARQRIEHWSRRAALIDDKETREAAAVVGRSYERILWMLGRGPGTRSSRRVFSDAV